MIEFIPQFIIHIKILDLSSPQFSFPNKGNITEANKVIRQNISYLICFIILPKLTLALRRFFTIWKQRIIICCAAFDGKFFFFNISIFNRYIPHSYLLISKSNLSFLFRYQEFIMFSFLPSRFFSLYWYSQFQNQPNLKCSQIFVSYLFFPRPAIFKSVFKHPSFPCSFLIHVARRT